MKNHCKMWIAVAQLVMTASSVSADTIKGKITDESGKPVRGALVRATDTSSKSKRTVAAYSQKDGQYSIELPTGNYEIGVEAYAFAGRPAKKDSAQAGNLNFVLTSKWDATRLTGSDIAALIPNDAEGKLIKVNCIQCHDLAMPIRRRGQTFEEWKTFLPNMVGGRRENPVWSSAKLDALSKALEKYYGPDGIFSPDAPPPTHEQVKHPDVSDAALTATITEWAVPSGIQSFPHSISVDSKRGIAWFSEPNPLRKIARFDIKSEKFTEFPAPAEVSDNNPHTPAIGPDGRVWYTVSINGPMDIKKAQPNLAVVDPDTNKITYFKYDGRPHTPIVARDGKVWMSGRPGIWSFDPETKQFKQYKYPVPQNPKNTIVSWDQIPGQPEAAHRLTSAGADAEGLTYHLGEDSSGKIWVTSYEAGMLIRIDPNTGEAKEFFAPNINMMRGMTVDQHDNVWFGAYFDHKLGKYDIKAGTFKLYQPPSLGAAPYGVTEDKKTGYIWIADMSAYSITRFDPKTEKFVEYRLPGDPAAPGDPAIPRFIDVDSDGRVWFADWWNGKIGVLDPNGASKQLAAR